MTLEGLFAKRFPWILTHIRANHAYGPNRFAKRFPWILTLSLTLPPAPAEVTQLIGTQVQTQKRAAEIQRQIDRLDAKEDAMVQRYRALLLQLVELRRYNEQLAKLIADQERERAALEGQLEELGRVKRKITPFLMEMAQALEKIVEEDTPFLLEERRKRVSALKQLLARADVSTPEKFRRLMEAFRIEAQYGHTIEAYEAPLVQDREQRVVRYLRFGRLGLYYLTLDGKRGGVWNMAKRRWDPLSGEALEGLEEAIRIAAKQAPPDFVLLPVPAPEAP